MFKRILLSALTVVFLSVFGLVLSGCGAFIPALDPPDGIIEVSGTNGAWVETQHGGAPWNTTTTVWVFVDNPTVSTVTAAVESLASELVASGRELGSTVSIRVVDGSPGQFSGDSFRTNRDFSDWNIVVDELGIGSSGSNKGEFSASEFRSLS